MKRNVRNESTPPTLKKLKRKLKPGQPLAPPTEDPRAELKRLVRTHSALTKARVALHHMSNDRTKPGAWPEPTLPELLRDAESRGNVIDQRSCRAVMDGTATDEQAKRVEYLTHHILCLLPDDDRAKLNEASKGRSASAAKLEGVKCPDGKSGMLHELRKFGVYQLFLRHVFGLGAVTCAYLCAFVDIRKSEKPSQLIRYCGNACIDGKAERRAEGCAPKTGPTGNPDAKGTYNAQLKTRIWQAMGAMWKNAAKTEGATTKYLTRWQQEKARRLLQGQTKGKAHDAGRRAATDLLLYDLYLVWRAVEGLPSWVTWYDWTRGYEHGRGPLPRENAPRMLTVEQALDLVGNVGKDLASEAAR